MKNKQYINLEQYDNHDKVCEPIANYCRASRTMMGSLFECAASHTDKGDLRVVELFAGVGGFRIGLERASNKFKTVWSNQWEPSTKRQDASLIYSERFGLEGHSNKDINTVPTESIPVCDMVVGGFPCQDYSVATTLNRSGGIQGKKGVLWWQIHRILNESKHRPEYLFFENVDRLLKSPASQRGRDFAIILASLSDLGYDVEWRVINAAEYGMPQRRRRTYIVGYLRNGEISKTISDPEKWICSDGVFAKAFPIEPVAPLSKFEIKGKLDIVSSDFNRQAPKHDFENAGFMTSRDVYTIKTEPVYDGPSISLGQIVLPDIEVPDDFFIPDDELDKWRYLKGSKSFMRTNAQGFQYKYSEGAMVFPDALDRPSRTIITGEGGKGPSRFKHVILSSSGRYRRLTPIELERLNMFPDNHTSGCSDMRRAFLMGNALVTGVVEKVGYSLLAHISANNTMSKPR